MDRKEQIETFLARTPIARTLGMQCDIEGRAMKAILPFQDKFIGNSRVKALHGGVIGTFLEMTAMAQLFLDAREEVVPRTINITIDYLRSGQIADLYGRASTVKQGRRMASVRAEAWQNARNKPVAILIGHFLLPSKEQP